MQSERKEEKSLHLSMPIIAEEEEEETDFSEAGRYASHQSVQGLRLAERAAGLEPSP